MGDRALVAPPELHKQNQRIDGESKQMLSCYKNNYLKNNVVVIQNITLADASLLLFLLSLLFHVVSMFHLKRQKKGVVCEEFPEQEFKGCLFPGD